MASKALIMLGLFAVLLVVSEVTTASGSTVKPADEILKPDQQRYSGNGGPITYGGGGGPTPGRGSCDYGCCYKGRLRCLRCCARVGEAVQTYQPGH